MRSTFVLRSAAALLAFAWSTLAAAHPLDAAAFVDATGDFLPTYLGPKDAALDVRFADVVIDAKGGTVTLIGKMAGAINPASGGFYVFGIDRGRGEAGRDLVFQGALGGEPKIGAGVRWDAAVGLMAGGQAVFFDALNPGIVPLPHVAVRIAGNEISATVPLALLPSQGFEVKDYTFNLWPRSEVSLANTTVADFAPDNDDAPVSVLGKRARFELQRSVSAESANCLAGAGAEVTVQSLGGVEAMDVSLRGLPPRTTFNVFVIQTPNAPFGLSWYLGDMQTSASGRAQQRFVGRFSQETFTVAPGSAPAPVLHQGAFPDAQLGPATAPVHMFHLGLWFDTPADAVRAGCRNNTTPFSGEHEAGGQALSSRGFADLQGPLQIVRP